jgi:hypothetical protein
MYGGDVFQRGLFVLAPDKWPYKQKFENADTSMDAKFQSSRLYKKHNVFPYFEPFRPRLASELKKLIRVWGPTLYLKKKLPSR